MTRPVTAIAADLVEAWEDILTEGPNGEYRADAVMVRAAGLLGMEWHEAQNRYVHNTESRALITELRDALAQRCGFQACGLVRDVPEHGFDSHCEHEPWLDCHPWVADALAQQPTTTRDRLVELVAAVDRWNHVHNATAPAHWSRIHDLRAVDEALIAANENARDAILAAAPDLSRDAEVARLRVVEPLDPICICTWPKNSWRHRPPEHLHDFQPYPEHEHSFNCRCGAALQAPTTPAEDAG